MLCCVWVLLCCALSHAAHRGNANHPSPPLQRGGGFSSVAIFLQIFFIYFLYRNIIDLHEGMKYAKLQLALLARLYYGGPAWLLVYICWEKGKKIGDVHISFLVSGQRIPYASLAADYFGIITPLHERVSEASSLVVCVCESVCVLGSSK